MEDEAFPWIPVDEFFPFPGPVRWQENGLAAAGGNLSPGMLLSAYRQGLFPWYAAREDPILWWSLDPRFVLFPEKLHVSKSLRKVLKKKRYRITLDQDFEAVISGCAEIQRQHEDGTWILPEVKQAYIRLHQEGYAHSVEVWDTQGDLAGGLYGVAVGRIFCGESMFARQPDASKAGFATLVPFLKQKGFALIDCQQETDHLARFGAEALPRRDFLPFLTKHIREFQLFRGNWGELFPDFARD